MEKIRAKIEYLPNYDRSWGPMRYAYSTDTGMDVRACVEIGLTLQPMERALVPLGFKLAPAPGFAYQIRAKSGNTLRGIGMANGVGTIDNAYRGEVCAIVINFSDTPLKIERGMKIAQLVVEPVYQFELEEAASLDSTDRGAGGFGSTGGK